MSFFPSYLFVIPLFVFIFTSSPFYSRLPSVCPSFPVVYCRYSFESPNKFCIFICLTSIFVYARWCDSPRNCIRDFYIWGKSSRVQHIVFVSAHTKLLLYIFIFLATVVTFLLSQHLTKHLHYILRHRLLPLPPTSDEDSWVARFLRLFFFYFTHPKGVERGAGQKGN